MLIKEAMTINDFNTLEESQKVCLAAKAKKVTERMDDCTKYELFHLENFYVEIRFCIKNQLKKIVNTYLLKELPSEYVAEVIAIPVVSTYK